MKLLSAIVPCYNEEENIADFYQEFMKNESFFKEKDVKLEIWYIDDGSKDNTVSEVKKLICSANPNPVFLIQQRTAQCTFPILY